MVLTLRFEGTAATPGHNATGFALTAIRIKGKKQWLTGDDIPKAMREFAETKLEHATYLANFSGDSVQLLDVIYDPIG